jgi:benzoylformate decarboxylase
MLSNRAYRILKLNVLEYLGEAGKDREFIGMDLTDPELRFDRLADAMGVPGRRVEQLDELPSALEEAVNQTGGPYLLDVLLESPVPGR